MSLLNSWYCNPWKNILEIPLFSENLISIMLNHILIVYMSRYMLINCSIGQMHR